MNFLKNSPRNNMPNIQELNIQEIIDEDSIFPNWKESEQNTFHSLLQYNKPQKSIKGWDVYKNLLETICVIDVSDYSKQNAYLDKFFKYPERKHGEVNKIITEANSYLKYQDNWDEEGSPGYLKATLERTKNILIKFNEYIQIKYKVSTIMPEINPGPDGSFDLYWESGSKTFLLNVPKDFNCPVSYCGEDDNSHNSIKGTLDDNNLDFIYEWIFKEYANEICSRENIG